MLHPAILRSIFVPRLSCIAGHVAVRASATHRSSALFAPSAHFASASGGSCSPFRLLRICSSPGRPARNMFSPASTRQFRCTPSPRVPLIVLPAIKLMKACSHPQFHRILARLAACTAVFDVSTADLPHTLEHRCNGQSWQDSG